MSKSPPDIFRFRLATRARGALRLSRLALAAVLASATLAPADVPPTTQPTAPATRSTTRATPPPTSRPAARAERRRFAPAVPTPSNPETTKRAPILLRTLGNLTATAHHSVATVLCSGQDRVLATVVRSDGYLVTKVSEITSNDITVRLSSGLVLPARIVGSAFAHDLALLKVDADNLATIPWADPETVRVGQIVVAAGPELSPLAMGVVSVAKRPLSGGFLGVAFSQDTETPLIQSVSPGFPAIAAGLRGGDLITHVNNTPYATQTDIREFLQTQTAGTEVSITVLRNNEPLVFRLTLAARPSFPDSNRALTQNTMGGNMLSRRAADFPSVIQTDLVLMPAQQGSPVLDLDGRAIGVNIARAGRVETFALPADIVLSLLPDLLAGKYPATTQPATPEPLVQVTLPPTTRPLKDIENDLKEKARRSREPTPQPTPQLP